MRPADPLATLARLKRDAVESERQRCALAQQTVSAARRDREREEQALLSERSLNQRVVLDEVERLRQQGARAVDLVQSTNFAVAARSRESMLEQRLQRARTNERQAEQEQQRARNQLARAEAEAQALARHQAHQQRKLERARENKADEAALELHASLRHRGRA